MLLEILVAVVLLIAVFFLIAAFQPKDFRVERHILVAAPTAVAFGQVNDLQKWQQMSPYARLDTNAKYTFEGPAAGKNASMTWSGNSKVGEGRMTIVESRPHELIRMRLDFERPFKSTGLAEFTFLPESGKTKITWSMSGAKNLVTKAMGLVMSMDKMIGREFENGLQNLKSLVEASPKK